MIAIRPHGKMNLLCGLLFIQEMKGASTWAKILKENNSEKGLVSEKTVCTMPVAEIIAVSVRNAASRPFQKPRIGDRNSSIYAYTLKASPNMTVDAWFNQWVRDVVGNRAPNTVRNYRERYEHNIQPFIGSMLLRDVKQIDCQRILNAMEDDYAGSTIRQTYMTMGTFFKSAKDNGFIDRHPMDGVRYTKPVRAVDDIHFLTVDEQKRFLEAAKGSHNYAQYALILETGLRTGEMIGLTWDAIDWEKRTLTVNKTLEFRYKQDEWRAGPPKTQHSYRTIPLTDRAYEILKGIWDSRPEQKESPTLDKTLEYIDRRTGVSSKLVMRDLVFVNWRTGETAKNSSYDTHLYKLCDEAGIKHFCMHALRHTYATRAIESGVQPKVLQKLLGQAGIKTTMDRYVHVTAESLDYAIKQFQQNGVV